MGNSLSINPQNGTPVEVIDNLNGLNLEDTKKLAQSIEKGIHYEFAKEFLVKPLPKKKIKKTFVIPVESKNQKGKDLNGVDAVDYETAEETKEVDSTYMESVVLKLPKQYVSQMADDMGKYNLKIEVGDVIISSNDGRYFDLFKDSKLIPMYDVVAVKR